MDDDTLKDLKRDAINHVILLYLFMYEDFLEMFIDLTSFYA